MTNLRIPILLIASCNFALALPYTSDYTLTQKIFAAKEVLDYGEPCSLEDNKIVVKNNIKLHGVLSRGHLSMSSFKAFTQDLNEIIASTGSLCDSQNQHLECNALTGTCDCGDDRKYGINTTSVWENGKCLGTKGSTCAPDDIMPGQVPTCTKDTRCTIGSSGLPCTLQNYYDEQERLGFATINDPLVLFSTIYHGLVVGTCKCL